MNVAFFHSFHSYVFISSVVTWSSAKGHVAIVVMLLINAKTTHQYVHGGLPDFLRDRFAAEMITKPCARFLAENVSKPNKVSYHHTRVWFSLFG